MHITTYFERLDPNDKTGTSRIIYRAVQIQTPLKFECVKKIANKIDPMLAGQLVEIAIIGKMTRFRIRLEDAATTAFARFQYEVANWESNTYHYNR